MILGFDTSTAGTSVCLLAPDGAHFARNPDPGRLSEAPAHARELMPAVAAVLEEANASLGDVKAIAVGVGPGTFTGLRIGVATARALARSREIPLRPVSSLAALAAGIEAPLALPLIDARRGEVFAALHRGSEQVWEPFASSPEALGERLRKTGFTPLAAGDGSLRFREAVEAAGASVAPERDAAHVVRALHVCRLGAAVPDTPAEAVLPNYLRAPDAKPRPR